MGRSRRRQCQRSARLLWAVALAVVVGGLVLGCGRGNFIGRQYDDLTAYYNTFYNARKAFEKGIESISSSDSEVDRTRYISIFPDPKSGSGGSSFEKAIEKSADLLREHPNSEWVDDALLLIGRSRYYQQNYAGAAQKFREVISLGADRVGEARFWLARTLVAADRFSEAAEALRVGLEQQEDYGTWTAQMYLVQGELFVRQEAWADAEKALAQGLEGPLPDKVGARAALLLGQVRETLEDFEGAQVAYERAPEYDPKYQIEFAARLGAIEMQGRHGDAKQALQRLEELKRDDDTKAMRGQIAIVQARLYEALGRPEKAKQALTTILRGEEAPTGDIKGRVHYDLATLYRDTYEDFTQAAAHFDTASTNLSSRSGRSGTGGDDQRQVLPRAPSDAAGQAERFRGLADRAQSVARLDSLLRLGRMPRAEFEAFVQKLRRKRLKERKEEAEARRREQQQFRGGGQRTQRRRDQAGPSQKSAVQTRGSDAGFLFHRDPALVQEGKRQFEQTWGDRPLVDNWRRVNAIQGGGQTASAQQQSGGRASGSEGREETSQEQLVDVSAVPRDSASRADMEDKQAVAQYELANALFRAASRPDSAETWFRRILKENADHSVARQALYGLAQVHRAQGDTAAAETAYRRIIEKYPDTPYAKRAREQLGIASDTSTVNLEASRADSVYRRAYGTWQQGNPQQAINRFLSVARQYPETSAAPRALLAAGVVYHRTIRRDSSEALRTRFEGYVDSLTQSSAPASASQSPSDTLSAGVPDTAQAPSSPNATPERRPKQTRDSTTARTPPAGNPSRPQRTPGGIPQRPAQASSDSTRRDTTRRDAPPRTAPTRARDSTEAPTRKRPLQDRDSTAAPSDSAAAQPAAASDTTQAGDENADVSDPFRTLLSHLTEQYSDSPIAAKAQTLLDHLSAKQAASASSSDTATPADTTGAPSAQDTTAARTPSKSAPPRTAADTSRIGNRPDSLATPARDSASASPRGPSPRPPADTSRGKNRNPE